MKRGAIVAGCCGLWLCVGFADVSPAVISVTECIGAKKGIHSTVDTYVGINMRSDHFLSVT